MIGCTSANHLAKKKRKILSIVEITIPPYNRIPIPCHESVVESRKIPAGNQINPAPTTGIMLVQPQSIPQKKGSFKPKIQNPMEATMP